MKRDTRYYQQHGLLRIFLSYFGPHRRLFLLDMLCALFIGAVDLIFPLISARAAQAALLRDPADLGCRCQTAAAAVRRHSPCGDSRKNDETAYSLSSLWATRLPTLPPKVQTHLMPSHAGITGNRSPVSAGTAAMPAAPR